MEYEVATHYTIWIYRCTYSGAQFILAACAWITTQRRQLQLDLWFYNNQRISLSALAPSLSQRWCVCAVCVLLFSFSFVAFWFASWLCVLFFAMWNCLPFVFFVSHPPNSFLHHTKVQLVCISATLRCASFPTRSRSLLLPFIAMLWRR